MSAFEDDTPTGPPARRKVRRLAAAGTCGVLLLGGGALVLADGGDGPSAPAEATATSTAAVERRDLVDHEELEGTLSFGQAHELAIGRQGTITGLPEVGTTVERGQSLAEVDGTPVPLLYGARPSWRALSSGVEDGVDVRQVEENLAALGFTDEGDLTVDDEWDSDTTAAVKDWQESLGMEETGQLALGDVVFQPGAVRVNQRLVDVGGTSGGPVLKVASQQRLVTVKLDANRQGLVAAGDAVQVELPDGTVADAVVYAVGTVATAAAEGESPTVDVAIVFPEGTDTGTLDQAPVVVRVDREEAVGVLAVPVEALLALREGGYGVEVVGRDGTTHLVAVEDGAFADGLVEVTPTSGELAEGDEVVVPA